MTALYAFVHAAMQRPDALHRRRKDDQAGVAVDPRGLGSADDGAQCAGRGHRQPARPVSTWSTCGPNSLRFKASRDSCMRVLILAAMVPAVLAGVAPASAEPDPSVVADAPPFVDHVAVGALAEGTGPVCGSIRRRRAARRPSRLGSPSPESDEAWAEVLALAPHADMPGMHDQFRCHWDFAELPSPARPAGTWSRGGRSSTTPTMVATGCNPGGAPGAVLMPLDPRPSRGPRRPHAAQAGGNRRGRRLSPTRLRRWVSTRSASRRRWCGTPCRRRRCGRCRRRIPFRQASFGDQGRTKPRWPSRRVRSRSTW